MKDKTILITGGTGSFGQTLTRILLDEYNPKSVRIYSRGEFLQSEMQKKFNDGRLRFLIGDVRDRDRLIRACFGVEVVVHAAALKQIVTAEYNVFEAIKTNIDGSLNVIDAAIENNIPQIIGISSDKATAPCNLYGATKMVMEKAFIQSNVYSNWSRFSCTRYGNVVGSRGSVVPLFKEQAKTGEITITDKDMTRYFLTLEQGARFVLDCLKVMKGGEIFVPKIPSMEVMDLADVIAPKAKRKIVGIRPGEKLHEVLITEEESRHALEYENYYLIEPEFQFWEQNKPEGGIRVKKGFTYTSENNEEWLSKEEIERMAK